MDPLMKAFKILTSNGIGFLRLCAEYSPYDLADDGIEISLAKTTPASQAPFLARATPHASNAKR